MLGKILEFIKLAPKYLIAILMASGIGIFSRSGIDYFLSINGFIDEYKGWIGMIFLISSCLIFVTISEFTLIKVLKLINYLIIKYFGIKKLKRLTPIERNILGEYIFKKTKFLNIPIEYGGKNDLVQCNIIYRSSNIGREITGFSYDMQPWAWKYLNKHEDLLYTPIDKIIY